MPEDSSQGLQKVAAIDIGSNSIHLLIALVDTRLNSFSIQLAEKATVRLGDRETETGDLTEKAMVRGLEALDRFKAIIDSHKVDHSVTVATSAVREAFNGDEFLKRIKERIDLDVDLISGAEEARLIYLGVLSGMKFEDRPHILLDIGGGSTELVLADGRDARALTSTKLGAVRLQKQLVKEEPISSKRRKFLKTFIMASLEPAVQKVSSRIKADEQPLMVATSGTALALGSILASEQEISPLKLHGYTVSRERIENISQRLISMSFEERRSLLPINDRRAEIIVPGALILQTAMQMLGVEELVLSERSLREGLIVDWMFRHGLLEDKYSYQSIIRKRTVLHQVKRFSVDLNRANRVSSYALSIYDQTVGIVHKNLGESRELLWAAAMLHTCGKVINISAYHKHSWYLIRHGELLGYSHSEHLMVAAIARYHRKSLPKNRHEAWQSIVLESQRKIVSEMSLILRLATSIDKRPDRYVEKIKVKYNQPDICFQLHGASAEDDLNLEMWSLKSCAKIFKDLTGHTFQVVVVSE